MTDEDLNAAVRKAEANFVSRYRGKCASIEFDQEHALVFWRLGKRWGLYVLGPNGAFNPLLNSPKKLRLQAGTLIADLEIQLQVED